MSKKTLITKVRDITRKAHGDIYVLSLDIVNLENKMGSAKYSSEYKKDTFEPKLKQMKKERDDIREKAVEAVRKLAREYMDKQAALDELRGDQITDDARLLTCGIKLTPRELEKMFDRNAGNGTMQQIIVRYANEQGMHKDFRRAYHTRSSTCVNLDHDLAYQADVALKHYDQKNAYEQIAGEGGIFDRQIAAAE